ncbi:unnamed protein product [Soboliphyme baturini]|uniref:Uncharacterized protein n=1 Tax=Soboliphyme baturini TaxID=241478 RepID=A0A183IZP6_9BILA|nr:unnamed protein product [Soboliphyme baturini]
MDNRPTTMKLIVKFCGQRWLHKMTSKYLGVTLDLAVTFKPQWTSADEFQDALEDRPAVDVLDLPVSIEESRIAMNLFLNNHLKKAVSYMEP